MSTGSAERLAEYANGDRSFVAAAIERGESRDHGSPIGLIGWLDYQSGPIAMSLFYFVPIVFAAWSAPPSASLITALAASTAWMTSELTLIPYATSIVLWNGFTRSSTFVIVAVMVGLVRRDRDRIHRPRQLQTYQRLDGTPCW